MRTQNSISSALEALAAARRVADYANEHGVVTGTPLARPAVWHMGALVADSVLQSGLNYATVVRPRVLSILKNFPEKKYISSLSEVVKCKQTGTFLNWKHPLKIQRFDYLVEFLQEHSVENAHDLRRNLAQESFRLELQKIDGIGPKTVDYMACLAGVDSIAVDRHVRNFARQVGLVNDDYHYLRAVFCNAADLLSISRRDFDAWVWQREAARGSMQIRIDFSCPPTDEAAVPTTHEDREINHESA